MSTKINSNLPVHSHNDDTISVQYTPPETLFDVIEKLMDRVAALEERLSHLEFENIVLKGSSNE